MRWLALIPVVLVVLGTAATAWDDPVIAGAKDISGDGDPMAAPTSEMGPSRPAEPPVPNVIAEATVFTTGMRALSRPRPL